MKKQNAPAADAAAPVPEAQVPAAAPAPAPKKIYRLKLDHDGIYWGVDEIRAGEAVEGDAVLDHAPDNPPGRYRWNRALACLQPLPPAQVKAAPEAPSLEQAFHALVASLEVAGHALPAAVAAWHAEFSRSLEGDRFDPSEIK